MKKRKKIVSRLLCAALITATLPIGTPAVYAAGEAADTPSETAYAEKGKLQTNYDLVDSTTDKPVQKVYFGKNGSDKPQAWKIVGKDTQIDGENIVLFAASPLASGIQFNANYDSKTYADSWKCTYPRGSNINTVYPNHYGGSDIRNGNKTVDPENPGLVGLLESRFTEAERSLMNDTTVYTDDKANLNSGQPIKYSTTDKLYLANGSWGDTHVSVGANNNLRIDKTYWGDDYFWLRAPYGSHDYDALVADPDICVYYNYVDSLNSVVPAFDLNLTSVIFASAAPAASSQIKAAKITETDDAMTFRWADETGNKIKSTATWKEDGVGVINKDSGKDVYLCVQGKNGETDWIWSQKVGEISGNKVNVQTVTEDVKKIDSLTDPKVDLTKCKIWLETTDTTAGLTYAKEVQEGYTVSITAGTGLEITSGNAAQTVNKGEKISDIAFNVKNTHYLENTDDFIKTINDELNPSGNPSGLKAAPAATGTGFTISGKPTRDVNIQLPAATAKQKAETPTLSEGNIKRAKNSLTITGNFETDKYGAIQYRCQQADAHTNTRAVEWTEGTEISGLQAGTEYTLAIRYKGKDNYLPSEPATLTISTLEDTGNTDTDSSTEATTPDTDKTYDSNKDSGPEVTKTGNTGGQAGSKSDPEGSNLVQTGDESSPALWLVLMLASLAGVAAAFYGRKKKTAK